jgi:integrase
MTNEGMRNILLIMALRGLRSGDVLRIQRADVVRSLATGKLSYEGKGRKRIEISALPIKDQLEALAELKGWERVRDLIVVGKGSKNGKIASKKVWRAARRIARKGGILEMNPHRYRHTFATNFLQQLKGDPNAIVKLQKYMAWESLATAARYVDAVSQDELDVLGDQLISDVLR